jgi:hypothetical protein
VGVSFASAKGYRAEHAIETTLRDTHPGVYRPRTGRARDCGDLGGLPVVVSVKDHARLDLSSWCRDLEAMVAHAGLATGVVWHKRRGHASPLDWYVTTTGRLWLPQYQAYADLGGLPVVVSVKDHARLDLSSWCRELESMVAHAELATGVVWHKRRGHASPLDWYVTTTGRLWLPQYQAYAGEWAHREGL